MCGRFTLFLDPGELQDAFPDFLIEGDFPPRYNIAPTQPVAVIPNTPEKALDFYVWGLIPSWSKDPTIGNRLINARSETIMEKPSFRNSFKRKRCLILANGFYEWQSQPGTRSKTPYLIHLKSHEPFAFAGLWDTWFHGDGSEIRSCTIITTESNGLMKNIHTRMPVILPPDTYQQWLAPGEPNITKLLELLKPFDSSLMQAYPVSKLVNNPSNDVRDCILPVNQ
jgi:putative SOS response-associated peptidase YedK